MSESLPTRALMWTYSGGFSTDCGFEQWERASVDLIASLRRLPRGERSADAILLVVVESSKNRLGGPTIYDFSSFQRLQAGIHSAV